MRHALIGIEMGTNDLYLIKKLKENGVTVEKLLKYSKRIKHAAKKLQLQDRSYSANNQQSDANKPYIRPIFHVSREEIKRENNSPTGPFTGNDVDSDLIAENMEVDQEESEIDSANLEQLKDKS